jgi:hypothetical protein
MLRPSPSPDDGLKVYGSFGQAAILGPGLPIQQQGNWCNHANATGQQNGAEKGNQSN